MARLPLWEGNQIREWDGEITLCEGNKMTKSEMVIIRCLVVNLTISLSDHLIPWSESGNGQMVNTRTVVNLTISLIILFPSYSGNLTISLSDHLIPFAQWWISPSDSLIILFPSHSGNLTISDLWSSYSLRTVGISPSHSLIILFPSHSGNLRDLRSLIILSPSRQWESHHLNLWSSYSHFDSGNLTISLSDHLIPFTQW